MRARSKSAAPIQLSQARKEPRDVTSRKASFAFALVVALSLLALLAPVASAAAPAWRVSIFSEPTNFPSDYSLNEGFLPNYAIQLTNVGSATSSGPVTVTVDLPSGITKHGTGDQVVELSLDKFAGMRTPGRLDPGESANAAVPVDVGPLAEGSAVTIGVTVSGGGALRGSQTSTTTTIVPGAPFSTPPPFGFLLDDEGLSGSITDPEGSPVTKAGEHPYQATLDFGFPSRQVDNRSGGFGVLLGVDGGLRNLRALLPKGLIVNPAATPVRCTEAQLEGDACPDASVVGRVDVFATFVGGSEAIPYRSVLYNMVPGVGQAAQLAFEPAESGIFVHIVGGVHPGNYTLEAVSHDTMALYLVPVFGVRVQLWGNPSDPSHDQARGGSVPAQSAPFLSMPTACRKTQEFEAEASSWVNPGIFRKRSAVLTDSAGNQTEVSGCGALSFSPTLEARPTTNVADSPSGLSVDLHIPQTNNLSQLATAHLRKAVVVLPEGLSLNPSSANGLEGCSSAQIGIDPSTGVADGNQPTCPDASRIGDVEVDTPLLPSALPGSVYVATPFDNPFDSLLAIYIAVNDPQTGVLIKLAGHVEADPNTGQLVTTFDENPQLPFTDFKLDFFSGPGAVLRTPSVCGTYSTTSSLTPWSAPESGPPATPSDSYGITANCSSSAGSQPNKPEFEAGAVSPIAGKYTPFVVHLKREDGSQQFKTLTLNPPPGLTAKLAGTPACSDAALAAAAGKSGKDEQASPSCPSSSQIGTVSVGAGVGPAPYYAKGAAYLAGPYKGAPLSMAIITPAVAGPYDLGTVVTRVALHVNPATTQITADADPVPSILQGIPLDVRSIDVALDKPSFSRTGTSCDPMAVKGNLISTLGQSVGLESPFQLGNCANLAFKPKLAIKLKGATKRGKNPALIATLSAKDGEANIASTAVTLPRSAFLDQSHIRTVCTRVQFAAGAGNGAECPAGSIYGTASAKSPLLDYTLTGNAYLRSSSHKLPDLVIALQGPASQPIAIELDGRTDSVKGALRNTFEAVPDAPVSSFRLELFGGKRGLVVNSRNLCANDYRANVVFGAQNGDSLTAKPKVQAQCPKAHKKKHKRHGHR
jgi:hypothetical protein